MPAPLYVSASARRAHTVLYSTRASTGRLSESSKRKGVRTKVPIEAQTTPFPFSLVCDFESFLTPPEREEEEEKRNSMKTLDVHNVSGFCCYRISSEPKYRTPPKVYSGPDPMNEFYVHVMEESRVISKIVSHQVPMRPMTCDEHKLYEAATECVNCGDPFSDRNLKCVITITLVANTFFRHVKNVIFN